MVSVYGAAHRFAGGFSQQLIEITNYRAVWSRSLSLQQSGISLRRSTRPPISRAGINAAGLVGAQTYAEHRAQERQLPARRNGVSAECKLRSLE